MNRTPLARGALEFSRTATGAVLDLASGAGVYPRDLLLNGIRLASASAQCMGGLLPAVFAPGPWLEVGNKLCAYRVFASADSLLPADDVLDTLGRISRLDAYSQVWALEGAGYYRARLGVSPRAASQEGWPDHALTPLHTGAGLALAEDAFKRTHSGEVFAVDRFVDDCSAFSMPQFADAMVEALGLVAITLYPNLISQIGDTLGDSVEGALFWHGVGRGLYFSPSSFLPVQATRQWMVETALAAPGGEEGRQNALSGLTWAMVLVNIRDPEVIAEWLVDLRALNASFDDVANGVVSALLVWLAASPQDRLVTDLMSYRPDADELAATVWDNLVRPACERANYLYFQQGVPLAGRVFRVRSPEDLAEVADVPLAG